MDLDFLTDKFIFNQNLDGPVLVTGAAGCIGSWVLTILFRSKIPVIALDVSQDKSRLKMLLINDYSKIIWEKCDITDLASLKKIVQKHEPTSIIHLAGLQVPFCATNPALGARVNVEGTINILEIAKEKDIKKTVYASSVAALGMPPLGPWKETLYGAYKQANEHTAFVYWSEWKVPSIGIRPNIVYGLARDQGVSSKNTIAIQAAALNQPYNVPYKGKYSWIYAGEAASVFITCILKDMTNSIVFNLNGPCETIENSLQILKKINTNSNVTCSGDTFPFPPDLDDKPLREYIGEYPFISVEEGINQTYKAFELLKKHGKCPPLPS